MTPLRTIRSVSRTLGRPTDVALRGFQPHVTQQVSGPATPEPLCPVPPFCPPFFRSCIFPRASGEPGNGGVRDLGRVEGLFASQSSRGERRPKALHSSGPCTAAGECVRPGLRMQGAEGAAGVGIRFPQRRAGGGGERRRLGRESESQND